MSLIVYDYRSIVKKIYGHLPHCEDYQYKIVYPFLDDQIVITNKPLDEIFDYKCLKNMLRDKINELSKVTLLDSGTALLIKQPSITND